MGVGVCRGRRTFAQWLLLLTVALWVWRPLWGQDLLVLFNEGVRLFQQGNLDEALALFRKVVEVNPDDGEAWVYIGTILLSKKDYEEAVKALEKAVSLPLPGPIAAQGWLNLGVAYQLGRRDLPKALDAYERALSFRPNFPEAHQNILIVHLLQGNFAEAVKAGERAFAAMGKPLKPELLQATFNKALELIPRDYDRALELLRSMAQQQLPYPEIHALLGQAYEGLKQFSKAALYYSQAAALAPQVSRYHTRLGLAFARMQRWSEAAKVLERAIALDSKDAFALTVLGNVYGELGRWQEAVLVLRRALEVDSQNWEARVLLANAYERLGQLPQALQEYLTALGLKEDAAVLNDLARVLLALGNAAEQEGRWKEAAEAYQQALHRLRRGLALAPNLSALKVNLAIALRRFARIQVQQGQSKTAEEAFQEAEKILHELIQQVDDPTAKLELARLLCDRKRYEEALKLVREVLAAQPKSEEAYSVLGLIAIQLMRLDDAEQAYLQMLKLNPKSADAMVGLGVVAFYRNRLDEAEAWFVRALEIAPNHPIAKQNLDLVRRTKERGK